MSDTEVRSMEQPPEFGEEYDAVVAGAGIGGLVSGALLARAGLKVLLVERHDQPGGYVTAYDRKGYVFQVPHLMGGCGPDGEIRRLLDYLGIDLQFVRVEPFLKYIYPEHEIEVPSDPLEYMEILKENFQPQTTNINSFFALCDRVAAAGDITLMRRPLKAGAIAKMFTYPFRYPKAMVMMYGSTTLQDLLDRHFTDDTLKAVIATPWPFLGSPPWELAALPFINMMKSFADGAFIPVGGYQALSDSLARAFVESGGDLLLGHEVTKINAEGGRVSGVETHPRANVSTKVAVSDVDSKRTFMRLVDRENFSTAYLQRLDEGPVSLSGLVVHLGMNKEVGDPRIGSCPVMAPPSYDMRSMYEEVSARDRFPDPGKIRFDMMVHSLAEPSLAPEGRSALDILLPGVPYDFMRRWKVESGGVRGREYRELKERYSEVAVKAVGRVFPDLIGDVEAFDVSTPITYERYTMSIDGCWYDSAQTPKQILGRRPGPKTSVKGLFMTGSKSVLGGGIYPSAMAGLLAADSVLGGKLGELF